MILEFNFPALGKALRINEVIFIIFNLFYFK